MTTTRLRRQSESLLHGCLDRGAEIVVMLHPDYQSIPKRVSAMASMIA
jgi:hypothetical protein